MNAHPRITPSLDSPARLRLCCRKDSWIFRGRPPTATVSSYPPPPHPMPPPSPGAARLGMALRSFEILRSHFLNQLLKWWNPTQVTVVPTKVRAVRVVSHEGICVSVYLCALIGGSMWEGLDRKEIISAPSEFLSVFPSVNQIWLTKNLKCEHLNCTWFLIRYNLPDQKLNCCHYYILNTCRICSV